MEDKTIHSSKKKGLLKLGLVENLKNCTSELNELLRPEDQMSLVELNAIVDEAQIVYINKYGYTQWRNDNKVIPVNQEDATYLYFETGKLNKKEEQIIGWFERKGRESVFKGVKWGTKMVLEAKINADKMFHWGDLYFGCEEDAHAFLEDIATNTIPEKWSFKNNRSKLKHPILKSYIENIFEVLKIETENGEKNKLVYSQDGKYLVFNTNLLDKFFHDLLVVVDVREQKDGSKLLINPRRVKKELELRKLGFARDTQPEQPRFFEKVEEIIYQPTWKIDTDFDKFTHIIDDRRQRFPIDMQSASSDELGRKLDDAITFAVAIAQRNYKFIVPMYRPQINKIQLLMPIYLKGIYSERPDFALVLTPDRQHEYYIPETILPLDAVYQNARLIAKPDETWLNPNTIL